MAVFAQDQQQKIENSVRINKMMANEKNMPEGKKEFARSLAKQFVERKGKLSEKQWYWVDKLAAMEPPKNEAPETELPRLFEMLTGATAFKKVHLKTPAGRGLALKPAGAGSKYPGTVNVLEGSARLGRIGTDAKLFLRNIDPDAVAGLKAFNDDPVSTAKAYGDATISCCFCAKTLTHPSSKAAGYGPKCASNYGLPWGE